MTVSVAISAGPIRLDLQRETEIALDYSHDRNEALRQALVALDGIREDLARMVGQPQPVPAPARTIITERSSDGVPVCVRCGVVVDDPMSHFYWHGRVDSNTPPTVQADRR